MDETYSSDIKARSRLFLFAYLAILAGFGLVMWQQELHVTCALLGLLAVGAICGYRLGAAYFAAMIAETAVLVFYGFELMDWMEPIAGPYIQADGLPRRVLFFGVVALAVFACAWFVSLLATRFICRGRPRIDACNRWFGVLFASAQAAAFAVLLLGGLLQIESVIRAKQSEPSIQQNALRADVVNATVATLDALHEDPCGGLIRDFNPYDRYDTLRELTDNLHAMTDPEQMHTLMLRVSDADRIETSAMTEGMPAGSLQSTTNLLNHPSVQELLNDSGARQEFQKLISVDPR